ncbi:MAG: zinc ribbon domain-containing protein [Gemmataceae bacterium]|nr:zinc ribbon domain-containing protein [Gemmataceae bacterium]
MSHRVTCTRCQHVLHVPGDIRDRWITCPRCLSSVPNPGFSDVAPGPAPAGAPAQPPPPEVLLVTERSCPDCGNPVEPSWRYCPHCDEPLDHPAPVRRRGTAESDVRFDTGVVGVGVGVLGMLGGLGMVVFYCGGGLRGVDSKTGAENAAGAGMVVGLVLFGLVIVGMILGGQGRQPGTRVTSLVLGGIALGMLVLGLLVASTVYLFAGCFEPCGGRRRPPPGPPPRPPAKACLLLPVETAQVPVAPEHG